MYLPLLSSPQRSKEAKQTNTSYIYSDLSANPQRSKQLKQANKQASTSYLLPYYLLSYVQLQFQLQLQLYSNDSLLYMPTYHVCMYICVCVCV